MGRFEPREESLESPVELEDIVSPPAVEGSINFVDAPGYRIAYTKNRKVARPLAAALSLVPYGTLLRPPPLHRPIPARRPLSPLMARPPAHPPRLPMLPARSGGRRLRSPSCVRDVLSGSVSLALG